MHNFAAVEKRLMPISEKTVFEKVRRSKMSDNVILTEAQMIDTFGKAIANRVRLLAATGDAVFEEFEIKGCTFLGGYDYYSKSYYILNANAKEPLEQMPKSKGAIITVRTKQAKKPRVRPLETAQA
jgi:hypothetical protein